MRAGLLPRVLVVVGAVLAGLGLIAGHVNRQLLDGPTFAGNVDEIRRDGDVAAAFGVKLTDQILRSSPDLVAVRPLVESVATRVAGSDALSGPTRVAASTAHTALTDGDADLVVLRIADAAAIVVSVLNALAPERAPASADVAVTLASVGSQDFASATIAVASAVDVLAWLLPLLALVCLAVAIWRSRQRWATATAAGWALTWAAIAVGVLMLAGGFLVRRTDDDELGGAVVQASWDVMVRPLWWGVAVLAAAGIAIVLAASSTAPAALARHAARVRHVVTRRPRRPAGVIVRALVAAVVGVAAIVDPMGLLEPLVVLGGVGLVLFAVTEVGAVAATARGEMVPVDAAPSRSRRPLTVVAGTLAALALVGGVVLLARPGDDIDDVVAASGEGTVCNGHAELCDRSFDEVAYVASHNAMSVAREPGWFLAEQQDPIPVQLDQGVRALLVDVWSGIPAGDVVRTAPGSYDEALAIANEELGPEIVDAALRLAESAAGATTGTEARFLCHGLCETGSAPLLDTLGQLRTWLVANPDEIVTLFIEDHVAADLLAADVEAAGLLPFVHTPLAGEAWPTLGEMIRSGQRLVVMLEEGRGGSDAPWLVNGFELTEDTPYTFPTVESFSCAANRGPADAPLFLLNHWLSGFSSLVTDAQQVNVREVLLTRAEQCRDDRGQIPNFVAVNYIVIGDVGATVDALNGVA